MALPKALPEIDPDRCTGCGRCVAACEPKVLWLVRILANVTDDSGPS